MSLYDPDPPSIGTAAQLRPYKRVDSRQCPQCGAVAGRCEHLQADEDIVWLTHRKPFDWSDTRWTPEEIGRVLDLHAAGVTPTVIADTLNTTRGAVKGVLNRYGRER